MSISIAIFSGYADDDIEASTNKVKKVKVELVEACDSVIQSDTAVVPAAAIVANAASVKPAEEIPFLQKDIQTIAAAF